MINVVVGDEGIFFYFETHDQCNDAVGDEHSDPALMEFLGAEMKKESGQFFKVGSKRTEIQL